jgi:hypothetical protein
VTLAEANALSPTRCSAPFPRCGRTASAGTLMPPDCPTTLVTSDWTRLGIQLALNGNGIMAGSPMADQISRPVPSLKPATGFQAASARSRTPKRSLPFQG